MSVLIIMFHQNAFILDLAEAVRSAVWIYTDCQDSFYDTVGINELNSDTLSQYHLYASAMKTPTKMAVVIIRLISTAT